MSKLRAAKSVLITVLTLVLFANPVLTLAQQASPASVPSLPSNTAQKCQKITSRISTMLISASARLQKRQSEMTERNAKIQKRIQELGSRGADTTKLSSDAQQLVVLQNQWVNDFQKYISLLQATQNFTCGDSQGKFKTAVQAVRDQLKVVRQDNQNIKSFNQQALKVDFQTARQSVKGKKANLSGNTTGATTSSPTTK